MSDHPLVKRFADLRRDDFALHPIWEQSWSDLDEGVFRPREGPLPASPTETGLLVRATATLADGTPLAGFVTPMVGPPDLSDMQPHVFVGDALFAFWGGTVGISEATQLTFHRLLNRPAPAIFPIRFTGDPALCLGTLDVVVPGFSDRRTP